MRTYLKPEIFYQDNLPPKEQVITPGQECIIVYDIMLTEIPEFKNWLTMFEHYYGVTGGEALKSIKYFPEHFDKICRKILHASRTGLKVIAVGGGSIGDFAGFFASSYKRGVSLINIPTTLLAAIDSAHGGKNGLNSSFSKNQIGTFYFPEKVFICRKILNYLPEDQILSGFGEVLKTAILAGDSLWDKLQIDDEITMNYLWPLLPEIVDHKYKVVEKDPFEVTNKRRILNLGHSLGHVLEKQFNLLHGEAVAQGLHFTLDWSVEKKHLSREDYKKMKLCLETHFPCIKEELGPHITKARALELLMTDKKMDLDQELNFVYLKGLGLPHVEKTKVYNIIAKLFQHSWVT